MTRVLIASADRELTAAVLGGLAGLPCSAVVAAEPGAVRRLAGDPRGGVLVLDQAVPGFADAAAIAELRSRTSAALVVLCAGGAEEAVIAALDAGADDALARPFSPDHLLARLRALLRRPALVPTARATRIAEIGSYTVDLASLTLAPADRAPGPPPRLTPNEWRLLGSLLERPGRVVPSQDLLRAVWGPGHEAHTNYLRVYMATLRRKLEPDPARPRHLLTNPGIGYRYQP